MSSLQEMSQAEDGSRSPCTSSSVSSNTPQMRQREREESSTCQTMLHHSKLSGFEVVSKLKNDSLEATTSQADTDFPLETINGSPTRPHRVVPVQVIECSPNQVSPAKETPGARARCGTPPPPPAPLSGAEHGVELPRFTAVNPKVTKLNLSRETAASELSVEFNDLKQDGHLFVPFSSGIRFEDVCVEPSKDMFSQSHLRIGSWLSNTDSSARIQFRNASSHGTGNDQVQVAAAAGLRQELVEDSGPFRQRDPVWTSRTSPIGTFKLRAFTKSSVKSKRKNGCPEAGVTLQEPPKEFASFLPKTSSMLAPTDDFSFENFEEDFRSEPGSMAEVSSASANDISHLELPAIFGSHFGRRASVPSATRGLLTPAPASTSPKHGRGSEGDNNDQGVKNKSPRMGEPSEEEKSASSQRFIAPSFSTTESLTRDSLLAGSSSGAGFSTPTGQMWQDLSTPPFLHPVSS
jgi:hypothetical protein